MKTHVDCIPCLLRQAIQVARLNGCTPEQERKIVFGVSEMLKDFDMDKTPPEQSVPVYDKIAEITGVRDPYFEIKKESNIAALKVIKEIRDKICGEKDELLVAARMSMAGNIIDYGASKSFDIEKSVANCLDARLGVDNSDQFISLIDNLSPGTKVLYLLDNCGEIVYDTLLLDILKRKGAVLTMVVRSRAIINDALLEDALFVGLDSYGVLMENGTGIPGTSLNECSLEMQNSFAEADIVISKGQGNFETLSEVERSIVFLLSVKCGIVGSHMSEITGVNSRHLPGKGEMVLYISN